MIEPDRAPSVTVANGGSTLRAALIAVGGYMVGKGYIDHGTMEAAVSVGMIVLPLVWAYLKNSDTKKKVQAAIDAPSGSAG